MNFNCKLSENSLTMQILYSIIVRNNGIFVISVLILHYDFSGSVIAGAAPSAPDRI